MSYLYLPSDLLLMKFQRLANDKETKARAGVITTDHGTIETPIFIKMTWGY